MYLYKYALHSLNIVLYHKVGFVDNWEKSKKLVYE